MPDPVPHDPDGVQLALYEPEHAPEPEPPRLDALIQEARIQAARASEGGAVGALVARLARGDGSASVAVLRAEGFPAEVIAAAVSTSTADRRVKPRARLGIVGGEPFTWLTTTGWAAAGRSSGRERPPSSESAAHAAAPAHLGAWLADALRPWPGLRAIVATGEPCRAFSEDRVKAMAWARIRGAGDGTGAVGALVGGLIPDALITERFPDASTYTGAWGHDPDGPDDLVEQVVALEIEDTRKADAPLRWKVDRWSAAIDLAALYAVVWVVRSADVADRLAALGVGTTRRRQVMVCGAHVGLGGDTFDTAGRPWWPLRLSAAEASR